MSARRVTVDHRTLGKTIEELRLDGHARTERFALWLGRKTDLEVLVLEHYAPSYEASSDYFHIGREEMARLIMYLRTAELMIGAQLHTHPAEAFHSAADDRWAIVRHVGALSIVLPDFGRTTTVENFFTEAKIFVLSSRNVWSEVPRWGVHYHLEVTG